jgi:adenylosuccinate lyase
MIERYTLPEMAAVWDERVRTALWVKIEIEAVRARVALGEVPAEVLERIEKNATVSIDRMKEIEQETHHDVIAFLKAFAEEIGEEDAVHVHVGMTSSDILDTTIGVQIGRSGQLILEKLEELREAVREKALKYRTTPVVGRTHGVHAEPTTLGLKFAYWWDELTRAGSVVALAANAAAVGKLSGAVGTYAELDPSVEAHVCDTLGIRPAPISNQVVARDRHARYLSSLALLGSVMARQALEIRLLARTETSEVLEGFGAKQKGSSAMPHKRNPIKCEQISGLARVLRANAHAAMENIELWHERDISHSSVERVILPDSSILTHYLLDRFTGIVRTLDIRPDRMRENIESSGGLIFSGGVLTALVRTGMSRDEAYDRVQRAAMTARERGVELVETLREDEVIVGALGSGRIERIMSLDPHTRHVDEIFERLGIEDEGEAA